MDEGPFEIVLVEDNEYDRDLALNVLRRVGLRTGIKVLRDGVEALDYFGCGEEMPQSADGPAPAAARSALPRLVLLDLKLPCVDGLEVLRRMKQCPATSRVPVVAFTSSRQASDVRTAYELGVNSYVVKPVQFEEYSETLRATVLYWLHHNLDTIAAGANE